MTLPLHQSPWSQASFNPRKPSSESLRWVNFEHGSTLTWISDALLFQVVKNKTYKHACAKLASKIAELTQLISEEVHARGGVMDEHLRTAIGRLNRYSFSFGGDAFKLNDQISVYSMT